ncbi:hypothetical protein DFP72DRAFT_849741 [Ephemerocybe angulata]|uniref:Uncharacterized protein n=1 Tax=Ephemerocybe angulata TaxID=980116 RepID=A0A8H6HSX2_9AGAR|nr:hypothetical protein DFP72DRAFT_849741 [Tulosesus angulatus]
MKASVTAIWLLFTALTTSVLAISNTPSKTVFGRQTNAQRLARGLPLLAPKNLFSPTRLAARAALPSAAKTPTTTCNFGVYVDGTMKGYLGSAGGVQSTPYTFSLATPSSPSQKFELFLTSATQRLHLMTTKTPSSNIIGAGSANSLQLASSSRSSVLGSTPVNTGFNTYYETTIWSADPLTGALSAWWVNSSGGAAVPVYFVIKTTATSKLLTPVGDVRAYINAQPVNTGVLLSAIECWGLP